MEITYNGNCVFTEDNYEEMQSYCTLNHLVRDYLRNISFLFTDASQEKITQYTFSSLVYSKIAQNCALMIGSNQSQSSQTFTENTHLFLLSELNN